jgi:hypothetical protein
MGFIQGLFLFAPLVLVPLAVCLVGGSTRGLRWLLPAAGLAAVSFSFAPGVGAGLLALPWLGATAALAVYGFVRLRTETAIAAGFLFLPVGGAWFVLSRLGASPMGFREPIVLLTAVHFHYAAFVTLVLVGLAGRVLGSGRIHRAVVAGTIAGTPLLAAGITFSRRLELLGAAVLCASLWVFAFQCLRHVAPRLAGAARVLLTVSAVSLFPSMAFALAYAWGRATGHAVVGLATVAVFHGPLNAFGFGLCGLLAFAVASTQRMDIRQ